MLGPQVIQFLGHSLHILQILDGFLGQKLRFYQVGGDDGDMGKELQKLLSQGTDLHIVAFLADQDRVQDNGNIFLFFDEIQG